jgi:hypothetical protein
MRTVLVLIRIETSTESFQRIQRMTPRTRTRTSQQNSTSSANETATPCRHLGMFINTETTEPQHTHKPDQP